MHFEAEVAPAVQARIRFDMLDCALELVEQAKQALLQGTLTDGLVECIIDVRDEMEDSLTFFEQHRMCGADTIRIIHKIRTWCDDVIEEAGNPANATVRYLT